MVMNHENGCSIWISGAVCDCPVGGSEEEIGPDPEPGSDPDEEPEPSVREDLGYFGPSRAPQSTIETPTSPSQGPSVCASCGFVAMRMWGECVKCQGERNRALGERLAEAIRELKDGKSAPEQERRLVKQLYEYGHPDVDGLLRSIRERREKSDSTAKPRRGA